MVDAVLAEFEGHRDYMRRLASEASGEQGRAARLALIDVIGRFGVLEDTVRDRLGAPSRLDGASDAAGAGWGQWPLTGRPVGRHGWPS